MRPLIDFIAHFNLLSSQWPNWNNGLALLPKGSSCLHCTRSNNLSRNRPRCVFPFLIAVNSTVTHTLSCYDFLLRTVWVETVLPTVHGPGQKASLIWDHHTLPFTWVICCIDLLKGILWLSYSSAIGSLCPKALEQWITMACQMVFVGKDILLRVWSLPCTLTRKEVVKAKHRLYGVKPQCFILSLSFMTWLSMCWYILGGGTGMRAFIIDTIAKKDAPLTESTYSSAEY